MANEEFWRWIGFAAFSHHQRVRGSKWQLRLDPCMVVEDVEIIRSVVEAEDPLAVLLGENRDPTMDDMVVFASRFYFTAPSIDLQDPLTADFTSSEVLAVQAIKEVSNGYSVLLPGYCKAWVRAEDIVSVEKTGNSASYRAPNLDVVLSRVTGGSVPGILAFFNAFGGSVRKITTESVSAAVKEYSQSLLQVLCEACPRLQEIDARAFEVNDLSFLNLSKLEFRGFATLPMDLRATQAFFEALSNPQHPTAKTLTDLELRFDVNARNNPTLVAEFLDNARRFLDKNRTLHTINFTIVTNRCRMAQTLDIEQTVEKFVAEQRNEIVIDPLPSASKLAALAAISRFTGATGLDRSILALVFAFTGEKQWRQFTLSLFSCYEEYARVHGLDEDGTEAYSDDADFYGEDFRLTSSSRRKPVPRAGIR